MRRSIIGLLAFLAVLTGAFLGLADFDIPLETLKGRYGAPPSRFVQLPGGMTAHYRDQGNVNGRVLVLLHGSNDSLFTWEPWVAELGQDYRLITVDLPGHGLSSFAENNVYTSDIYLNFVSEFIGVLQLDTFVLGGNSMGGKIAWRYALDHPEKLEALVLLDASGIDLGGPPQEEGLLYQVAETPGLNKVLDYVLPEKLVANTLRDAIYDDDLVTQAMVDQYHDLLLREGRRQASKARLLAPKEAQPTERLGEISVPTLILWGEEDTYVSVEAAYIFDAQIPNSALIVYPEVGHLPMVEVPEDSAASLKAFLILH
ncbi:MAG: alpha/beta hydrolase [Alphaproteobacteria bacterium]|nr:MAG: alpha/beta hydrolase [Alphaproteobacteria bacterium]